MNDERKGPQINWGSVVGWVIFIMVLLAGPLSGTVRRIFGGALPTNWISLLPFLIGGLVVLSIVVSAVRAYNQSRELRGPTLPRSSRAPAPPPPPFRGAPPASSNPRLPSSKSSTVPSSPQFEPLISPRVLAIGVIGLVVLGALGLFVVFGGAP